MQFSHSIGIEYTFTPNDGSERYSDVLSELLKHRGFESAHSDAYHVEVPSPVHKSWHQVESFYTDLMKVMSRFYVSTHVDDYGTGGGHIHVGLNKVNDKIKNEFLINLFSDVANRPYLNWIFNEWCDSENANHLVNGKSNHHISGLQQRYIKLFNNDKFVGVEFITKFNAISINTQFNTIEFRIFDMSSNYEELKEHINFVLAYFNYILKETKKGRRIYLGVDTKQKIDKFDYDLSCNEFNKLLVKLNLNVGNYNKYIDKNYKNRIKYGKLV